MRILAVSDEIDPAFYDHYRPGKLADYDLIVSCGDLPKSYLEFLVTMARCPLFYVSGNHDDYEAAAPEGCECIDGRLVVYRGVRILGLGGSMRYRKGKNMYTERGMRMRILRALPAVFFKGGVDVLVTHAPAEGIHDLPDLAHRGFACFARLIGRLSPKLMLHGHVHPGYAPGAARETRCGATRVINVCPSADVTEGSL